MKTGKRLNARAFTAMMMVMSGLGLPLTGVMNHAYGFAPLSVGRHAWMSAHNALGVLFAGFSIWHIVLNRRAVWNHLRSTASHIPAMSREAMLAGAVVAITLLLFVGHTFHAGSGLLR
jgi:hypothetical protein